MVRIAQMQTSTRTLRHTLARKQTFKVHLSIKANMLLLIANIKIQVDFFCCCVGEISIFPLSQNEEKTEKLKPNEIKCQKSIN